MIVWLGFQNHFLANAFFQIQGLFTLLCCCNKNSKNSDHNARKEQSMPHIFFQKLENRQSTQTLIPYTPGNSLAYDSSPDRIFPIRLYYGIDFPDQPLLSCLSWFSHFFPWIDWVKDHYFEDHRININPVYWSIIRSGEVIMKDSIECGKCDNTGNCPHCDGRGITGSKQKTCRYCRGSGTCQCCNGRGLILVPVIEQVN